MASAQFVQGMDGNYDVTLKDDGDPTITQTTRDLKREKVSGYKNVQVGETLERTEEFTWRFGSNLVAMRAQNR